MRLERADLLQIYYLMRLTRAMEDRTRMLFLQGRVVGGVYTAQGHEATTVGAASTLGDGDFHRTATPRPRHAFDTWRFTTRSHDPVAGSW